MIPEISWWRFGKLDLGNSTVQVFAGLTTFVGVRYTMRVGFGGSKNMLVSTGDAYEAENHVPC